MTKTNDNNCFKNSWKFITIFQAEQNFYPVILTSAKTFSRYAIGLLRLKKLPTFVTLLSYQQEQGHQNTAVTSHLKTILNVIPKKQTETTTSRHHAKKN